MTLALPTKRDEDWRWTDLSAIDAALAARPAANDVSADHKAFLIENITGSVIVFCDGRFASPLSRIDDDCVCLRNGHVSPQLLSTSPPHPLQAAAADQAAEGIVIRIGAGHATAGTLQVIHIATGGAAHLAHRYELAEDAQASVVETYVGAPESWTNVAVDVALARSARLMRTVRRLGSQGAGAHSETLTADVGQAASYQSTWLLAGAEGARIESEILLSGEGAFAGVDGVLLARATETLDVVTRLRHAAPSGQSRQTWRSVADEQGTASVSARVEVTRDGQKTDAAQSVKGLLLKRTATINAKPELEIFADDVKCAHGATVGELSREALFYLESRGIAPAEAKALLTQAFIADALSLIGKEPVREALQADAVAWLRGGE